MPSSHDFLKLKARFRTTAQARLFPLVKNEKNKLQNVETAGDLDRSVARRPSCLNSFVSSFSSGASSSCAASALDLKNGRNRGLTAAEAFSRVFATPSVHRRFRQPSEPRFHRSQTEWIKSRPGKVTYGVLNQKADGALGRATDTVNSDDRVSAQKIEKESRFSLSSLRHEVCKDGSWRRLESELREDSSLRGLMTKFNKSFSRTTTESKEDGHRGIRVSSEETFDTLAKRGTVQKLFSPEKVGGEIPVNSGVNGAMCLEPVRNRSVSVGLSTGSAIVNRAGVLFTRALHEVSLAGEGMTLDRSSENENSQRQPYQSASDGNSLKLLSAACNIPHPDKIKTGGEDSYFICPGKHVIGVADGVGGWADLGIDAGEYARELMSQAKLAVQQEPAGRIDPAHVMEKAHSLTKCRGSSTACILALTDSTLEAANLGDSGFVIVRNSRTIFKSPVQQHQFNIPFQLENGGSDPPSAAQVFSVEVAVGDVIVAGTDGLFDNLYDSELTTIVVQAVRVGMTPQVTAQKIADLARARAQDRNRQTPFSTAAQDAGYRLYGGKMDDITVVVSYITTSSKPVMSSL